MRNLIVGVDGTDASFAALRWAADTVGHEGRLHAVVAVNPMTEYMVDLITGDPVQYRDVVDSALAGHWTYEIGYAVGELTTSINSAPMAEALEHEAASRHADAIVLGRHGGVGGIVTRIGHSTNQLLRHTQHPVIVVPAGEVLSLDRGIVVVGIGHGNATRSAVRWAAHLARTRRVSIELLHATGDAPIFQADGILDLARYEFGGTDQAAWETGHIEHFAQLMQAFSGPELDMAISTPPGLAALRLDDASERSSLLVIGRHRSKLDGGHHTAQPLRHALTHALCPVAVIPDHPTDEIEIGETPAQ